MVGQTGMNHGSRRRPVVVGVDGGGTKSDVIVADLDGVVLATRQTGGANPEGMGADRMAEVLAGAIDETLGAAGAVRGDVVASAFGLAGVDWDSDVVIVDAALAGLALPGPRTVVNDSQVALRAGCSQPWGIVSSVGTGTVSAGVNRKGERFRTMAVGWGEPSGSWSMVSDSLHAVAAHHHGVGPPTLLTELYLAALNEASVESMFESITRGRSSLGAHLAPLLDEAVGSGDQVARDLLGKVSAQHADMVIGVASRLGMTNDEFELVTSGGVHGAGGLFGQLFAERVVAACPGATLVPLRVLPAMGAISLALDSLAAAEVAGEAGRGSLAAAEVVAP